MTFVACVTLSSVSQPLTRAWGEGVTMTSRRHHHRAVAKTNHRGRRFLTAGGVELTRASGPRRIVLARYARNRRLADALYHQAFTLLGVSPGARDYYDRQRARGATHHQALRALANRLVGILHGCLRHHSRYDEATAWHAGRENAAA